MSKNANLIVDPNDVKLQIIYSHVTGVSNKLDTLLRLLQPNSAVTEWLLTIADREFHELNDLVRSGDANAAKEMDVASKAMEWLTAVERTAFK